jgi:hypothetical protein
MTPDTWHPIAVAVRGEWINLPAAVMSRNVALAERALGRVMVRTVPRGAGWQMEVREVAR